MHRKIGLVFYCIFAVVLFVAIAFTVMYFVSSSGNYPSGSDTMYHIYRGKYLYNNILEGNWYPTYDPTWYNGVELMRYWAPLAAFLCAGCEALAGFATSFFSSAFSGFFQNTFSSPEFSSYILFVGIIFLAGALVWLYIGVKIKRPIMGTILGILWFIMPNNLYALFGEGNLARSVSMIFLPLFMFGVYEFLSSRKTRFLCLITISFTLIVLCHLGYAGMVALSLILFLILDMIINRRFVDDLRVLISTALGFALPGIWVITNLIGGVSSVHTLENTKNFFQSILISLNPLYRYEVDNVTFYFGLAAFALAIFGAFFGYKKTRAGFLVGIITLILTTETMYQVVALLPGSSNLWMLRFISIALCFILISFIEWKTLKKPLVLLFVVLLFADTVPSLSLIYGDLEPKSPEAVFDEMDEETLIADAKKITKQRLCILDESTLGSRGAYLASAYGNGVNTTFGAGWEAAETSSNISQLNRALAEGHYLYMFDRCVELGNDTVLVRTSQISEETTVADVDAAAAKSGYKLVKDNAGFRLYSLDFGISENWGLISKYNAIGIGSAAASISRYFPCIKETSSTNLNDYTFDELKDYDLVYLAGFTYDSKSEAEELVMDLSEAGVRVVIAADGIPEERVSHNQSFLGVICNTITFSQGYPLLETIDGELDTDLFPAGSRQWNTVYCDGLDDVWGMVKDDDYEIPFYGTVKNDNIVVIGLNLTYYLSLTGDEAVEKLLGHAMDLSPESLPERNIVPIDIDYTANSITINSDYDGVNTTLAYHNMFMSDSAIYRDNNLLMVGKGETHISFEYPYLMAGLICSFGTLAIMILYFGLVYAKIRYEIEEANEQEELALQDEKAKTQGEIYDTELIDINETES